MYGADKTHGERLTERMGSYVKTTLDILLHPQKLQVIRVRRSKLVNNVNWCEHCLFKMSEDEQLTT